MQINDLEVTLYSQNHGINHSFQLVKQDNRLVLMVAGKQVASLTVETMEKDVKDEEGDYHTKASDNFFINFVAEEAVASDSCHAMAFVGQHEGLDSHPRLKTTTQ